MTRGLRIGHTAVASYPLTADQGAYSVTGRDASLRYSFVGGSAGSTTLTLQAGPVVTGAPFRSGVPLPLGTVFDATQFRLTDISAGTEIPVDSIALGRWPDGSINSILLVGKSDVSGASKSIRLDYGPGISRTSPATTVSVSQSLGVTTVDTGTIVATIGTKGTITSIVRGATTVVAGGDAFMVRASDSTEFTALNSTDCVITLEETGPVRAVVKAYGTLRSGGGVNYIKYLIRYYFVAGSDIVDMDFTVVDPSQEAVVNNPTSMAVSATAVGMRWTYTQDSTPGYRFGGDSAAVYSGNVTAEHYQYQSGNLTFQNGPTVSTFAYSGVGSGSYAEGWMTIDTTARHIALMVRDFWQQYPAELNVNGGTLTAYLFAPRSISGPPDTSLPSQGAAAWDWANSFYFLRPGGAKTWELRMQFASATPASATVQAHNTYFQRHQHELRPTEAWMCASKVFGDIAPNVGAQNTPTNYHEILKTDIFKNSYYPYVSPTTIGPSFQGQASQYGYRYYGDHMRAGWSTSVNGTNQPSFYNGCHVGANKYFVEYMVTGDQEWFRQGAIETRHGRDWNYSHGPRQGYWNGGTIAAPVQPAGEQYSVNHDSPPDLTTRSVHPGHTHVSGLPNYYLLTGDKRSKDVLEEIAGWQAFMRPYWLRTPFVYADVYREAERDYAWPIYAANEYVRTTGSWAYHSTVCKALVDYMMGWWKTPLNHIGWNPATDVISNSVIEVNNYAAGNGYWTMTRMDNYNTANLATGCNPWMAGPLLGNLCKWHEMELKFQAAGLNSGVNMTEFKEMLYQCLNYVVKHGWRSDVSYFVYSETTRTYSGGNNHLMYPIKYIENLYVADLAAGTIANPAWHTTRPQWASIATTLLSQANGVRIGSQSYGMYGYEQIYPLDFLKLMGSA